MTLFLFYIKDEEFSKQEWGDTNRKKVKQQLIEEDDRDEYR
jgi:hypothetical protein